MNKEEISVILFEEIEDHIEDGSILEQIVESILKRIPDSSLEQVEEFSETFEVLVSNKPTTLEELPEILKLRISLMFEELKEFCEASGYIGKDALERLCLDYASTCNTNRNINIFQDTPKPNLTEMLDALCDMRVVNDGTILACGLHKVFDEAMREVHNSNMSKLCNSLHEAKERIRVLEEGGVIATYKHKGNGKYVLIRYDGKVLKGFNFKTPNLTKLLE
jgi:predicted HAD superfamily Cof-like phosphohydrolase